MSIEEVKNRVHDTPISDILGRYLQVEKKSGKYMALCPFHNDSNPSLHIDDKKNMWFCFVDNIGGDAIKFVMEKEKLEFIDALKDICGKMGWNWEDLVPPKKEAPRLKLGRKIMQKAGQIYQKCGTDNKAIFENFLQVRGIEENIAGDYALGLAPNGNVLANYLLSIKEEERDKALKMAQEIGLIKPDHYKKDSFYDTFRNRIMFPIWDQGGKVIGFTGRALNKEAKAKYINSQESFLFNKRNLLYGLHLAKKSIRKKDALIIVEGNMDQMMLYQHGFQNSVAVMGVALGMSSLKTVLGLTKNIYLALDNDQAGYKAAERMGSQFMTEGVLAKFVDINPCKDPDEFVSQMGILEFGKRLEAARSMVDVQADKIIPAKIPELSDRRIEILHRLYALLAPLGNSLAAKERIAGFAARLGLKSDAASILGDYENFIKNRSAPTTPPSLRENIESKAQEGTPPPEQEQPISRTEKLLFQEVIRCCRLLSHTDFPQLLDFMPHNEVKQYIRELREIMYEVSESEYRQVSSDLLAGGNYSRQLNDLAKAALKLPETKPAEDLMDKIISDIKQKLHYNSLRQQRDKLLKKQKMATTDEELSAILTELTQVDKELVSKETIV